jgi:hypothetical protein
MRATFLIPVCLLLLSSACTKEPGEGGKAVIKGVVMRQNVNGVGNPVGDAYPYQDNRVFIIYGDHDFYDDDVRTGPDGNYEFRWLRKGDYTIYTFGECNCPGNSVEVVQKVTVGDRKEVVTVPTITVDNY